MRTVSWLGCLAVALTVSGCGGAGGGQAGCEAGYTNYCKQIFTCDAQLASAAAVAFQSEANCAATFRASCAAVQFAPTSCVGLYNTCASSLQGLSCANFSGTSFELPQACDDANACN